MDLPFISTLSSNTITPPNDTSISTINRQTFFDVTEPFSLSKDEFKEKWKEVDNIWTQLGNTKTLKKDPQGWTKTYYCRFKKL
ncbi:hypothetical protein BC937DRAFT_93092 [Endogone sp. FLAS-F59071]|nr:hypothetical protein BC937DRAFT_93092 [Endogone sp. FLAS-F59071]|eukprot:RUS14970.1 hypothetical protein BC937DRAFT_93092 [Endogone sp. FLAS-F59071]